MNLNKKYKKKSLSEEHKKKLSKAHKGKKVSKETRLKMSEAHKGENHPFWGKKHSKESKQKMSISHKGKTLSEECKKKLSDLRKGKPLPEEWRNNISKSLVGIKLSEEHKESIRKTLQGRTLPEEVKNKIRNSLIGKKHPFSIEGRIKIVESNKKRTGIPLSEEHRKKLTGLCRNTKEHLSENHKKKLSDIRKNLWTNPDYAKKMMLARNTKPNKQEKKLNDILQNLFPKEYKLNVKANVMILGGKIPDLVNVNGKKKLVELWGNYWHRGQDPNDRINYFKQFGWNTLVVWEKLKKESKLRARLINFHEKGIDSYLLRRIKNDSI